MTALLERLLAWLNRRCGVFELTEAVVLQHGSSWVRIAPDEPPRWYLSEESARRG